MAAQRKSSTWIRKPYAVSEDPLRQMSATRVMRQLDAGSPPAQPLNYTEPTEANGTALMNVPAYLDRIGYKGPTELTSETLRLLHRRHLETVPFENLDISRSRPIVLNESRIVHKVVEERRGGFCYELNLIISPCGLTWSNPGLLMSVLATPFWSHCCCSRPSSRSRRQECFASLRNAVLWRSRRSSLICLGNRNTGSP